MAKEKKTPEVNEEETKAQAEPLSAEITALKESLESLEKEKAELNDRLLRTAAEYENYRRRTAEEMTRKRAEGKAEAIVSMLSVMDSIKLAMNTAHDENDPMYKGLSLIAKQMADALAALSVSEIETNIPFDPNLHNAVMHIDSDEFGEGEIVECFAAGYKMGDRVLRYAMVKVAN